MMATNRNAKILLGVAIAGCLFSLYLAQYVWRFYPDALPELLAFAGPSVTAFSIALGAIKRPAIGIAVFLLLGGAVGALVGLARLEADDRAHEIEREVELMKVAEAVCMGKPNAVAEPARGQRKMMVGSKWPDMTGYAMGTWEGFPAPRNIPELQLVVCRVGSKSLAHTCSYDNKNGGTFTLYIYQSTETLTVRDAKTAEALGEKTFEGAKPSGKCDESIVVPKYETSRDSSGMSPDHEAEAAWVKTFVAPAEN